MYVEFVVEEICHAIRQRERITIHQWVSKTVYFLQWIVVDFILKKTMKTIFITSTHQLLC